MAPALQGSAAARLGGGGPVTGMNRGGDRGQETVFPQKYASNLSTATSGSLLILEAYEVRKWLARRRHWHVLFTPTSASWINQVERWFAGLTRKKLQRGVHRSVAELNADIMSFIDAHNEKPKPYKWVKSADEILASVRRFCLKANALGESEEV